MTTLTGPAAAGTGAPPPAHARAKEPTAPRFATWRNSWAVALRMARRDVRRHKGRSLIVLLMVGVPTALLVFALSLNATSAITSTERIPYELGSAAGRVGQPQPVKVIQNADLSNILSGDGIDTAATAVPGFVQDGPLAERTAAIGRYFHGTALPIASDMARVTIGASSHTVQITAVDGRGGLGSLASLVSGRWPTNDDEVAVNRAAIEAGLPSNGRLDYRINGETRSVTVVGVVAAAQPNSAELSVVTVPDPTSTAQNFEWLIMRSTPLPWSEVKAANAHGMTVLSAAVLRDPPPTSALDPMIVESDSFNAQQNRQFATIGGTILLLVTTLLVGPAFAVSAARSRRTLALAAANGASTSMLRRTVLAQALVLGALSALIGTGFGVLATWLASAYVLPALTSGFYTGPLDVPVLPVAGITAVAMISSIIAALIPARRLGKIDISGVMKGQNVSPPLSRTLPIVGGVGAGVGGVMLFNAIITQQSEIPVVIGAVLLIVGTLMVVPLCIVIIARGAAKLPVALRMATRDAARQRTRSAPSVAAIVGALAALTMIGVGLTSDTEQQRRNYQPQAAPGQGYVSANYFDDPSLAGEVTETIQRADPTLTTSVRGNLQYMQMGPMAPDAKIPFVNVVPAGCTAAQTLDQFNTAPTPEGQKPKCARLGSTIHFPWSQVAIIEAAASGTMLGLTPTQTAAVRAGGAIVIGDPSLGASLHVASGTYTQDPNTGAMGNIEVTKETDIPVAAHLPISEKLATTLQGQTGLVLTPEVAKKQGWTVTVEWIDISDPAGPISPDRQSRLDAALASLDANTYIERGFQRQDIIVMSIVVGIFAFLVLVITLTSTALSMAEQRKDDATLAALGATRRTRRGMAAAQAFVLAGIGAVLGLAVGLVPGIAIAYPLTREGTCDAISGTCTQGEPIIVIPWLWLGVAVIGTTLLAAAIAWVAVRRAPMMTRRAT